MAIARRITVVMIALPLAAFFAFVGYFKAFAPLATLAEHHAWTVALPEWIGRIVGATELAAAATLAVGMVRPAAIRWAAGYLILNQACAAAVHLAHREAAALPQNAAIAGLCVAAILLIPSNKRGDLS